MRNVSIESEIIKQRKRDGSLDIAKGIMMLSVVAGHIANFPFGEVFYYYHVAGFFLLSGYFFNYDKYADNFIRFLKSRSKLIYQYLIYSAVIIAAHNLLIDFGLQPQNYVYYSLIDYATAFIRSITIPSEAIAGAMWFIPVLILMQFVFYWINRMTKGNKLLIGSSVLILFFIGWWIVKSNTVADNSYINHHIPNAQYFVYLPFFYIGYTLKEIGLKYFGNINVMLPALIIVVLSYITIHPTMYLYGSVNPYCFIFLSLVSIFLIIGISQHIRSDILAKTLMIIGENTVHILAMHFVFFKVATLFLICIGLQKIDMLHNVDAPSNGSFIEN
ncbi:acyltransferase family protein, partial [Salmonella enterica]|nr:acyltransferase family protein [Salmonella enterica]